MSKALMAVARPGFTDAFLRRGRLCACSAIVALGLLGCEAKQDSPAPPPPQPVPGSLAVSTGPVWTALAAIERRDISQPKKDIQGLVALLEQLPVGSAERLEAMSLLVRLLAYVQDGPALAARLTELEQWPAGQTKASADLVLRMGRASKLRRAGEQAAASRALEPLPTAFDPGLSRTIQWRAQLMRSNLMGDRGEMDAAISSGLLALKQADDLGSSWRRANTLASLAYTYFQAQQLDLARKMDTEALREALLDPDPVTLNVVYTSRAIIYSAESDTSITRQAQEQALAAARDSKSDMLLGLTLGNYADYHLRRGNYASALQFAQQALQAALAAEDTTSELLARHNIGIAKIGLHRIEEGKREVIQVQAINAQRELTVDLAAGWLELGQYLERAGDLAGAVHAYHQERKYSDVVQREEGRKAVLELQAHFDSEQRAKQIALLNRDNELKAAQITARDLKLKLWAALGGCVGVSAVLLAMAYRRMRSTNQALKHANESLRMQSERDPLTGLSNRRHFQAAIKKLADQGRLSGTVFLIDIDHFKRINDVHGHAAGDSVLIEVARRLRATLREEDLVVRWGGEEFLIVMHSRDAEAAHLLAQRLLEQIGRQPCHHGKQSILVTASIGFASFPIAPHNLAVNWERAIDLVDTAMYMAKAHGRNRAYGIDSMAAHDEASLQALASRLEAAWHEGQVQLSCLQGPVAEGAAP